MGIKETPTSNKTYYKSMQAKTAERVELAKEERENLINKSKTLHEELERNKSEFIEKFGINLDKYPEFVQNTYISGKLLKVAKGLLINKENDYELIGEAYDIYKYAELLKTINDINKQLELYNKLLKLSLKEYTEILRAYYTEVHKQLILEGKGYAFSNDIGWICVNRCVIRSKKKTLDFAATKKREAELRAQGKRIYNKEEAEWCQRNGLEYKAEDKRVYKQDEYCYEIPLMGCKLPNGTKLKLQIGDYRHSSIRGKSNDELIAQCNSNTERICNLPIDLKTKLTLCDKADKILYTKFIRNETQTSVTFTKVNSKDRQ